MCEADLGFQDLENPSRAPTRTPKLLNKDTGHREPEDMQLGTRLVTGTPCQRQRAGEQSDGVMMMETVVGR